MRHLDRTSRGRTALRTPDVGQGTDGLHNVYRRLVRVLTASDRTCHESCGARLGDPKIVASTRSSDRLAHVASLNSRVLVGGILPSVCTRSGCETLRK